jgi:hypothetical protein
VRRELMLDAVARYECHPPASHVAHGRRSGRRAERGLHLELLDALEEGVEPGASEDPDLRSRQAVFSLPSLFFFEDWEESEDDVVGAGSFFSFFDEPLAEAARLSVL